MASLCFPPFVDVSAFPTTGGYVEGRVCQKMSATQTCCLPCPMYDWFYPDSYAHISTAAGWVATVSVICGSFLLLSWAVLPKGKTARHYLSICLTIGVVIMSLAFVIPLAAKPNPCYNKITPHGIASSAVCGASGAFLIGGGWAGVMWAFLRSLSLHLQICWQKNLGKTFMWFCQAAGWGVPIIALTMAMVFSGVSYRFGPTCQINSNNSLATCWIPLLVFAGATVVITFTTFGYCIKVYLDAMGNHDSAPTEESLPTYTNSTRTMTPSQAYRRIRRVILLQWRGIAIVLIIIADVIFFSIVLVFQDNVLENFAKNPQVAAGWIDCLVLSGGDKTKCYGKTGKLAIREATVGAVLLLLALNGVWLLFLLGRLSMFTAWFELFATPFTKDTKEFISVDASQDITRDKSAYMMLSRETSNVVTPLPPVKSPTYEGDRQTQDYVNFSKKYGNHQRTASYASTQPGRHLSWSAQDGFTPQRIDGRNPLGMHTIRDDES